MTFPSEARRSFVRTNAPPLPGLTCWNSRTLKTVPSTSMWLPFLNWFVEMTILVRDGGVRERDWEQRRARVFAEARRLVLKQRVDGYVRVSRIGGRAGDGYISPEVQREQISAFASLMGVEIDAWHDDQDYSGGNVERPGFLEAIRRVESGETGGVIVARIDRFARSAPDGGAMVRRIIDAGGISSPRRKSASTRRPTSA